MELQKSKKNIAIIVDTVDEISETFIKNHIKYLPHYNFVFSGFPVPLNKMMVKPSLFNKFKYRMISKKIAKSWLQLYQENQFTNEIKNNKIDIVFAEFLTNGVKVLELCKKNNLPLIVTALGYDISIESIVTKNNLLYKELFDYCQNIVIVSKHMKDKILEIGCDESKIIYSPCGPDESFFNINPNFKSKQIFALGRFVDKKGPIFTLLAFKQVLKKVPNANLVFGGEGQLWNAAKDLSYSLGMNQNVLFPGFISQDKQKEILSESIMFVQHSQKADNGDSEGTPVALLEASAASLPVVSTFHAGIPDVILNNKTGFLVKEKDVNNMAEKMIYLLENIDIARDMGKAGKKYVEKNFSLESHISDLNECILRK